jgi:hypothetical protein
VSWIDTTVLFLGTIQALATVVAAHWHPAFKGADDAMEAARLELDEAIDQTFG